LTETLGSPAIRETSRVAGNTYASAPRQRSTRRSLSMCHSFPSFPSIPIFTRLTQGSAMSISALPPTARSPLYRLRGLSRYRRASPTFNVSDSCLRYSLMKVGV